jgi:hypothetical protein
VESLDIAIVGDRVMPGRIDHILGSLKKLRNIKEVVIRDATVSDYQDVLPWWVGPELPNHQNFDDEDLDDEASES